MEADAESAQPRRAYNSPRRAAQAAATRRRVLEAAAARFVDPGYAATTLKEVAADAGVAADTVLHLFGSKRKLLDAALGVVAAGDAEDRAVLERDEPQAMRDEPDQRRQIEMFAAGITAQLERVAPVDALLRAAGAADREVATARDEQQLVQRRRAMATVVSWVAAHGPLRAGLSEAAAADIVWALTTPETYLHLREVCGWDRDRYRAWLADLLIQQLL